MLGVDPAQHKNLKRHSLESDRSIDELVTEAVADFLEKHTF